MISLFFLTSAFGLFFAHAGDMFVVKEKCYLPLFTTPDRERSCETGNRGCNCDTLDTVLLPRSVIEVLGYKENGIAEVKCEMTKKVKHKGYIYTSSIENSCSKLKKGDVKQKRSPMPLNEIRSVFKCCICENVPYCWGSNQFEKIPLPNNVNFKSTDGNIKPYELRGFDCSGILYYISDGTLPHATGALKNFGTRLFTIEAKKHGEMKEDWEKVVASLRDTDFIAIKGHVIISYNGGFIEFRSKDLGCQFTETKGAVQRVKELIEAAKDKGSDVWFVRWHPENLQKK